MTISVSASQHHTERLISSPCPGSDGNMKRARYILLQFLLSKEPRIKFWLQRGAEAHKGVEKKGTGAPAMKQMITPFSHLKTGLVHATTAIVSSRLPSIRLFVMGDDKFCSTVEQFPIKMTLSLRIVTKHNQR